MQRFGRIFVKCNYKVKKTPERAFLFACIAYILPAKFMLYVVKHSYVFIFIVLRQILFVDFSTQFATINADKL